MKKVFYLAMMVVALVACEQKSSGGGGGGGSSEGGSTGGGGATSSALVAATANMVDKLGANQEVVEKDLLAAGFIKLEKSFSAPARLQAKKLRQAKADYGEIVVEYAYNVPENYAEMSEEEAMKWLNSVLKSNKELILLQVSYQDSMLQATSTNFVTGIHSGISKLYTADSDALYKKLSANAQKAWHGVIMDAEAMSDENFEEEGSSKQYDNHAQFVAAIAADKPMVAEEYASDAKESEEEISGFYYFAGWAYPDENMVKELIEESEGILEVGYAYGTFNVADINYDGEK